MKNASLPRCTTSHIVWVTKEIRTVSTATVTVTNRRFAWMQNRSNCPLFIVGMPFSLFAFYHNSDAHNSGFWPLKIPGATRYVRTSTRQRTCIARSSACHLSVDPTSQQEYKSTRQGVNWTGVGILQMELPNPLHRVTDITWAGKARSLASTVEVACLGVHS